jgi:proteic killer suppression protein
LDIFTVEIAKSALKDMIKIPKHVILKLQAWVDDIENIGLREARKTPGYHDEPLKGKEKRAAIYSSY